MATDRRGFLWSILSALLGRWAPARPAEIPSGGFPVPLHFTDAIIMQPVIYGDIVPIVECRDLAAVMAERLDRDILENRPRLDT